MIPCEQLKKMSSFSLNTRRSAHFVNSKAWINPFLKQRFCSLTYKIAVIKKLQKN